MKKKKASLCLSVACLEAIYGLKLSQIQGSSSVSVTILVLKVPLKL